LVGIGERVHTELAEGTQRALREERKPQEHSQEWLCHKSGAADRDLVGIGERVHTEVAEGTQRTLREDRKPQEHSQEWLCYKSGAADRDLVGIKEQVHTEVAEGTQRAPFARNAQGKQRTRRKDPRGKSGNPKSTAPSRKSFRASRNGCAAGEEEERIVGGARSSEPTLRRLREGWGTLKINCWVASD
jgi:hypothetical protein